MFLTEVLTLLRKIVRVESKKGNLTGGQTPSSRAYLFFSQIQHPYYFQKLFFTYNSEANMPHTCNQSIIDYCVLKNRINCHPAFPSCCHYFSQRDLLVLRAFTSILKIICLQFPLDESMNSLLP